MLGMEPLKTCSKCGKQLPFSFFYKKAPGKLFKCCKSCELERQKVYRTVYKTKYNEDRRKYRQAHAENERARVRTWRNNNPEKNNAKQRRYYAELRDFYIRTQIFRDKQIQPRANIPQELIEAKREQLKMYRATKQLITTIKEKQHGTK